MPLVLALAAVGIGSLTATIIDPTRASVLGIVGILSLNAVGWIGLDWRRERRHLEVVSRLEEIAGRAVDDRMQAERPPHVIPLRHD